VKLLLVSQYFWPESFLINRLCRKLSELGHQVTVITAKPNYPQGEIFPGYKAMKVQREEYYGIEVVRIPICPRKRGVLGLIANYISFVVSGVFYMPRLVKGREFDVILVYAVSPITAAIPAVWIKRKLGSHLAIWVQDLWPQSLSATGYIKSKTLLKIVGRLVSWIYSEADTLLGQSRAFVREIGKYADNDKILYYPNSIEPPAEDLSDGPDIDTSCLENGFSVVFAGNIGKAQAIPTLIEAASLLVGSDCRMVFIGDGSMLDWARQEVSRLNLGNVSFMGRVESNHIPWLYHQADALLVSLADEDIFSFTIPSKIQSCLAAGKPIVASVNGEAAEIIVRSGSGRVTPAADAVGLAGSILEIRNMSVHERREMGCNGLKYFQNHFDMNVQSRHLIDILDQRLKGDL